MRNYIISTREQAEQYVEMEYEAEALNVHVHSIRLPDGDGESVDEIVEDADQHATLLFDVEMQDGTELWVVADGLINVYPKNDRDASEVIDFHKDLMSEL